MSEHLPTIIAMVLALAFVTLVILYVTRRDEWVRRQEMSAQARLWSGAIIEFRDGITTGIESFRDSIVVLVEPMQKASDALRKFSAEVREAVEEGP